VKTCAKCKLEKPFTEFAIDARRKSGVRGRCKACESEDRSSLIAIDPEKYRASKAKYRLNNKDAASECDRRYYIKNKEASAAKCRTRRSRKLGAEGLHTAKDINQLFNYQRGLCANCETKLLKSGKNKFHADHIRPLSKGGSNDKYNLQCLCPTCNLKKGSKDPILFASECGRLL
jgi:5-methylcytosine-specific restriction endonuclease McrA